MAMVLVNLALDMQYMNNKKPLISICCITFDHEKYIRDAIDGFLMQKTDFPFEIIIHDDASTDNTANIIREYEKKFPDLFVCIYQEENQWSKGIRPSPTYVWPKARGKYIALCEGDDYWTDPYKLQKQVNFLEANPEYVICFHKVMILKNKRLVKDYITKVPADTTTLNDLIKYGNYIHTPSVLFRNGLIKEFPEWYKDVPIGDYPLYILLAQYGKIKFINEVMAVYRVHKGGIWSHRKKNDMELIKRLADMKKNLFLTTGHFSDINKILSEQLAKSYLQISELLLKKGDLNSSINMFNKAVEYNINVVHNKYFKYKSYLNLFINFRILIKNFINFIFRFF